MAAKKHKRRQKRISREAAKKTNEDQRVRRPRG
jgi:hypothetical protein